MGVLTVKEFKTTIKTLAGIGGMLLEKLQKLWPHNRPVLSLMKRDAESCFN